MGTASPSQAPRVLARRSFRRSWLFLSLGFLLSGVAVGVLLGYHLPEPLGVTSITTNGHTYVGNPPALTLFERDPVSFVTITVTLGVGLLVSLADLGGRCVRRSTAPGTATMVAGAVVVLVSLFGLFLGLLGVGVVGLLLVGAGLPSRRVHWSSLDPASDA